MGNAEGERLREDREGVVEWKRWGPYVSDRAWGTVREDYSATGQAWSYLPHDHARSRAYRWNEDGIAGICDRRQRECFAIAVWNHRDPILKERFFGLTGEEGVHGEDVKELYYHLDNVPSHAFMRMLYRLPIAEFPYDDLIEENRRRTKAQSEYELLDTPAFNSLGHFDIEVRYAKSTPEDILIEVQATNRSEASATVSVLPTVWFRNTWTWDATRTKPCLMRSPTVANAIEMDEPTLGTRWLFFEDAAEILFTENETNYARLFGAENASPYVKDAFHRYVVDGDQAAVNPDQRGTKAAGVYEWTLEPGETRTLRGRWTDHPNLDPFGDFAEIMGLRRSEADDFHASIQPDDLEPEGRNVMRQAIAGMLWSKQYYHYEVERWLEGDATQPAPPSERKKGRNADWKHLHAADVISMPDKWEYPWFAAWDLAFHCLALSIVDADFAKEQLLLLSREWYMHPNGQLPAYEYAFGDVNPPVHAWSALRVYRIDRKRSGVGDIAFLKRIFHKLSFNFTWWVNRKDASGRNLFEGGFLGLDNVGVFDRSRPLPTGGILEQADGTAWMAMYSLNMMAIALEIAVEDPTYEDVASKFWEHFTFIAKAMSAMGGEVQLWDAEDEFFYDALCYPDGRTARLKVRSIVGLIPLFAIETLDAELLDRLPGFRDRLEWFIDHRPDVTENVASMRTPGEGARRLLSIVDRERLVAVLRRMLDETEFLSPYGLRSISKFHEAQPYIFRDGGQSYTVDYEPGESTTSLFGGNSNWRGPLWVPMNYLMIEALQKYDYYYGSTLRVECPTGSGVMMTLWEVAAELSRRLNRLFLPRDDGSRPVHGAETRYRDDPNWRDLVLFYEYFHGDDGKGLGAAHQTGWTGLVAKLLQQSGV